MTAVADRRAPTARGGGRRRQDVRRPRPLTSGWWPALLATLAVVALLVRDGTSLGDVLAVLLYLGLGVALPGTLLWRLLVPGGRRAFYADVGLGTALGYTASMFAYLLARAVDLPRLAPWWALVVLVVSLLPATRRRCWRPRGIQRTGAPTSWALAGTIVAATAWVYRFAWPGVPSTQPGLRFPYIDLPYHLALVGELRHHVPAQMPMVAGEPLRYHWFGHAEMAATSWATGVEPVVLMMRLSPLGYLLVSVVAAAALAAMVTRRPWTGAVAAGLLVLGAPQVSSWTAGTGFLSAIVYLSPTQTYALAVSVPVLAAGVQILRRRRARWPLWLAFVLAVAGTSGAKGTFLPLVLAGLLGAAVMASLFRRDRVLRAVVLFVLTLASLLLAQALVYGAGAQGLVVDPFATVEVFARSYPGPQTLAWSAVVVAMYLGLRLLSTAGIWGMVRRRAWRAPDSVLLVGFCLAGVVAVLAFDHAGLSQLYFLRSIPVAAAAVAAIGLSMLLPRADSARSRVPLMVAATAAGVVTGVWTTRRTLDEALVPRDGVMLLAVSTLALLVGLAVVGCFVRPTRRPSLLVVCGLLGLSLAAAPIAVQQARETPRPAEWQRPDGAKPSIAAGGISAARWLRDRSSPQDVVATNTHCTRPGVDRAGCDNRRFWMSAYSERRMLVEGWSYSPRTAERGEELGQPNCCLPFWDPSLLAANDAAFTDPSPERLQQLTGRGVRWLFVDLADERVDLEALAADADLRHREGGYAVLELRQG